MCSWSLPTYAGAATQIVIDAEALELAQLRHVVLDRAQHAEALDDLVGHELGVGVPGPPVL